MSCSNSHGRKARTCFARVLPLAIVALASGTALGAEDDDKEMGWFIPKGTPAKNFYIGARAGIDSNDSPDSNQDGSVTGISKDETGRGKGLILGYQINDNVAIEGGYRKFAKSDFKGESDGSGGSWIKGSVRATHEASAWDLGVLGRWQIAPRWYALGYLGWSWWESKETFFEGAFVSKEQDSGGDAVYAIGLEYDVGLKDRVVYRFMGTHHRVDDSEYEINSATAEIIYRFP
jgi:hypothetical protein